MPLIYIYLKVHAMELIIRISCYADYVKLFVLFRRWIILLS